MKNIIDHHRKDPIKDSVLPFLSSIEEDLWLVKEDVLGTIAHVIMLYEQKIITKNEVKLILNELNKIYTAIVNEEFKIEQKYEDIHPYIEALVIEATNIEIGGKIHSARSRNDQVALDIRLKLRTELVEIGNLLHDLINVLLIKAEANLYSICPLYTHLQKGQIGVFGHYFMNYANQILRVFELILVAIGQVNRNPLGACAIGGSSFPISRKRTSELLGFDKILVNSIDAVSSRDHLIFSQMVLTLLADAFTRIAEDLIIWSSNEFGYVELSDGFSSVSSAMPQKKNPDTMELLKGKMSRIYSGLTHLLFMSKGTPSGYVRDFQESKVPLAESTKTIKFGIKILTGAISELKINKEKLKISAESSLVLALDLAEFLAQNTELSFREAHNLIGALIRKFESKKEVFKVENISKFSSDLFDKKINLTQKEIDQLKDLSFALENRKSLGSPNPNDVQNDITRVRIVLKEFMTQIKIYADKFEQSETKIADYYKKL